MTLRQFTRQDIGRGNLILVNQDHPQTVPPTPQQLEPVGQVRLERQAAAMFQHLMTDESLWDTIQPVSGWRGNREQRQLYQDSLSENGLAFTKQYVALPGCSEHETGLAIDVGLKQESIDFIRPDFPYHGCCMRFRQKGLAYGFIQRYPAGKEATTGIAHEPWHFRYVGFPHALLMANHDLTLEEYIQFLKQYPYGGPGLRFTWEGQSIIITYLAMGTQQDIQIELPVAGPCQISGNNEDGFILTCWQGASC